MSKERLAEIIDDLPYSVIKSGEMEELIAFAIEQAERVQELEKEVQQEKRDRIVERAKEDVEEIQEEMTGWSPQKKGNYSFRERVTEGEFIVDKRKRTVVSLIRGTIGANAGLILERGIAKCAPGDCFNVHIGKAISLRRALGLDVPDEYINAPQPTEVRVGDIIRWKTSYRNYRVDKHRKHVRYNFTDMGSGQRFYGMEYRNIETVVNIIDDSREEEEIR